MASQLLQQRIWLAILVSSLNPALLAAAQPCSFCHKNIASQQATTAMANTWQPVTTPWLQQDFDASRGGYQFKRTGKVLTASLNGQSWPISFLVGGSRHGLGFLFYVDQWNGIPLARRTLIQARFAWSPEQKDLLLAPGSSPAPATAEASLGVVLSPTFERRCLACHGQPQGSGLGGVHCAACHDPAAPHVAGAMKSIDICARCHVGLTHFSDPEPEDLLIANQVQALQSSECYLQSGKAFSCTTCHDPHQDATDNRRTEQVCLGCHAQSVASHATTGCVECHMPAVQQGPLYLVDHWIRVHPGQKAGPVLRSHVPPLSEYLRTITTKTAEAAARAEARLQSGESFYQVALEVSMDSAAPIGGYLGRKTLADLPPEVAQVAAGLDYGEISKVIAVGGQWTLLQRLPRDFQSQAQQLQKQAEDLAAQGDALQAIGKAQAALKIYPRCLRSLNFIGSTFARSGNLGKAAQVEGLAVKLYPNDASARFALASILNATGNHSAAIDSFNRVIQLEPDFTAAYVNLGMIYCDQSDWPQAISVFRRGLQIDPLSAELNQDLGKALISSGDVADGEGTLSLARALSNVK